MSDFDTLVEDCKELFKKENMDIVYDFSKLTDMRTFGRMDSTQYRARFDNIFKVKEATPLTKVLVIFLLTLIKNPSRIIEAVRKLKEVPAQVITAVDFIEKNVATYVGEASSTQIIAVKVPETYASYAVYFHARFICEPINRINSDKVSKHLVETLYFGHMDIPSDVRAEHKKWEKKFWTETVVHSKNKSRNKAHETGQFYEDIYNQKTLDKFPFINAKGKYTGTMISFNSLYYYIKEVQDENKSEKEKEEEQASVMGSEEVKEEELIPFDI